VMTQKSYDAILAADPKASDRWTDGVVVKVTAEEPEASIDIVEVKALPNK